MHPASSTVGACTSATKFLGGYAMKFRPKKLSLALARTFGAGMAVTVVSVAYAQPAPGVPLAPTQVTRSRLVSPNITSPSPVAQVTATDIKLEGVTNVETLRHNVPQLLSAFSRP